MRRRAIREAVGHAVQTWAEPLERRLLMAVDPLGDLNTTTFSSRPDAFATTGDGQVFFRADDGIHGQELFVTDGTAAGTRLVKDIRPGRGSGIIIDPPYYNPTGLAATSDAVYFAANDGAALRLWRSDGTAEGTRAVQAQNAPAGLPSSPRHLTAIGDTVYFVGNYASTGPQLWKTDGTDAGTVMVKRIGTTLNGANIQHVAAFGDRVVFSAGEPDTGQELWISDGTEAGTRVIADINPGSTSTFPEGVTVAGDTLYFTGYDPDSYDPTSTGSTGTSYALYAVGPDAAGPRKVFSAAPVGGMRPGHLTAVGGELYFTSTEPGSTRRTIWRTDGTAEATVPVAFANNATNLTAFDDTLYFSAQTTTHGIELFTFDDAGGIRLVAETNPGTASGSPQRLTAVGSSLYFGANAPSGKSPTLFRYDAMTRTTTAIGGPLGREYFGQTHYGRDGLVHPFAGGVLIARSARTSATNCSAPRAAPATSRSSPTSARPRSTPIPAPGSRSTAESSSPPPVARAARVPRPAATCTSPTARPAARAFSPTSTRTPASAGTRPTSRADGRRGLLRRHHRRRRPRAVRTDGTAAGTWLVADLIPGPTGSSPTRTRRPSATRSTSAPTTARASAASCGRPTAPTRAPSS